MKEQRLKKNGTPYKQRSYHKFADDSNGWRTLQEVGDIVGISKNRVCQIFTVAMEKIAQEVFIEHRGRKPNAEELSSLVKSESLTDLVVEELMQSSVVHQDP